MVDKSKLEHFLIETVADLLGEEKVPLSSDTVLLGKGSVMSSLLLVGLLVAVEDFCLARDIPFEWATDAAMSDKRSRYRTIGALTEYLHRLSVDSGRNIA